MKTYIPLLLLISFTLPNLSAQTEEAKPLPPAQKAAAPTIDAGAHFLLKPGKKIEMANVNLGEFIDLVNQDGFLSVVISKGAKELRIPSIRGQNMSITAILSMVEATSDSLDLKLMHRATAMTLGEVERYVATAPDSGDDWSLICRVRESSGMDPFGGSAEDPLFDGPHAIDPFGGTPKRSESPIMRSIYMIRPVLSKEMDVEALASAIELVWEEKPKAGTTPIKLHEQTGLLICRGSAEQIALADQLIAQLPGGAEVLQRSLASRPPSDENKARLEQLALSLQTDLDEQDNAHEMALERLEKEFSRDIEFQLVRREEAESRMKELLKKLDQSEDEIIRLRRTLATENP